MNNAATMTKDDTSRDADIETFIASTDWVGADRAPLRVDASVRRYYRLTKGGKTAVLMDARPPLEDTTTFVFMAEKLRRIGFSVPEIYGADHPHGLVLMEDFGDETFFDLLTKDKSRGRELLTLAVDALIHKYKADPKVALDGCVAYSDEYWLFRVEQFLKFYLPQAHGKTLPPEAQADYLKIFKATLDAAHDFPPVLLHGDYGAQNLFLLPDRSGIKKLGIIDFQDMTDARGNMSGSPAFDLMFLLQDVRMTFPVELEEELKARFIRETGITEVEKFNAEYCTISAAQSAKCLGLFARLGYVEKREFYLQFLPNCWRNLDRSLQHPALADLKRWFDAHATERV